MMLFRLWYKSFMYSLMSIALSRAQGYSLLSTRIPFINSQNKLRNQYGRQIKNHWKM